MRLHRFTRWVYCAAMDHMSTPAPHTLARASDPSTSHLAAGMATNLAADHRARVLSALVHLKGTVIGGAVGAEEIAELCGLDAYQVRKRLPELQAMGQATPTGETRRTSSGRQERLWRLTTAKA